ncbi:MAG: LPS-assembly protein LptD [Vicinamibacterales bacterium]
MSIDGDHYTWEGTVEIKNEDWTFYADVADYYASTHMLVAKGNVLFTQGGNRLGADSVEFDTESRTGIFYNASGSAVITEKVNRGMFGSQEPDMLFRGETIEKIGDRKYKITNGGFTTCVQPTPRWELTSGTVVLNIDEYAFLKGSVLKVKGVPMLYLPALYYPINKEDRATGFLMPSYGSSTYQGFRLSNAFFWALGRSHDATFMHDWYTKTGQGFGGEYRYVAGPGSQGDARVYLLREKPLPGTGGTASAGQRSYEIRSGVSQALGKRFRARGRVDYFSSVTTQQIYNQNIYDASRRQRSVSANIGGTLGGISLSGGFDRTEYFFGESNSILSGAAPRIQVNRPERPIPGTPLYFSIGGEYAGLVRESRTSSGIVEQGLSRIDFGPRLRFPFTRLQFLTVNSSVSWRGTYYTESLDPVTRQQVAEGLFRKYFEMDARVVGPVVQRVFNTPGNGYAERFKHTVEPFFNVRRQTLIDRFDDIVKLEGGDYTVGGTTQLSYGLTTRLLARRAGQSSAAGALEVVSVGISQTYYTNARASLYDYSYSTSFRGREPTNFSPIAVTVRTSPSEQINGTLRMEYDTEAGGFQSIAASGTLRVGEWLDASGGWSHRRTNLSAYLEYDSLNVAAGVRSPSNRVGGTYSFNYDIGRRMFIQNRMAAYYNIQCCGFGLEYQGFNFQGLAIGARVPKDTRVNFSFTLAGLGTFSNFFGALGGGR